MRRSNADGRPWSTISRTTGDGCSGLRIWRRPRKQRCAMHPAIFSKCLWYSSSVAVARSVEWRSQIGRQNGTAVSVVHVAARITCRRPITALHAARYMTDICGISLPSIYRHRCHRWMPLSTVRRLPRDNCNKQWSAKDRTLLHHTCFHITSQFTGWRCDNWSQATASVCLSVPHHIPALLHGLGRNSAEW